MKKIISITIASLSIIAFSGCAMNSTDQIMAAESQVKLRSFQTKTYQSKSKKDVMRGVVSVLQDLSFIVDKADFDLGTITATKLDGYNLKMSVTVRPKSETHYLVRSNIQYGSKAVEEAKPYQDFFTSLDKALFLDKNKI